MPARRSNAGTDKQEAVRVHRLRSDARRPMAVNLREGIELSHFLLAFVGAARQR
jgi:hypothetical protein